MWHKCATHEQKGCGRGKRSPSETWTSISPSSGVNPTGNVAEGSDLRRRLGLNNSTVCCGAGASVAEGSDLRRRLGLRVGVLVASGDGQWQREAISVGDLDRNYDVRRQNWIILSGRGKRSPSETWTSVIVGVAVRVGVVAEGSDLRRRLGPGACGIVDGSTGSGRGKRSPSETWTRHPESALLTLPQGWQREAISAGDLDIGVAGLPSFTHCSWQREAISVGDLDGLRAVRQVKPNVSGRGKRSPSETWTWRWYRRDSYRWCVAEGSDLRRRLGPDKAPRGVV